jgi:predicted O-methyltransferase YrrM
METGEEARAVPILASLSEEGVAEAAFFLGVARTRHGDLPGALSWMERALQLNPSREPTREQVENLRRALGISPTPSEQVTLEEALRLAAATLGLNARELAEFAEEDVVGGYGPLSPLGPVAGRELSPNNGGANIRRWPGGSVWEDEGRLLYALVRALRPKVVVEVGSLVGCSTSHLAAACRANGVGKVYAVDPAADFSSVDPELLPFIEPIREDVFTWTAPKRIDFLFEDGSHEPGFTQAVLERLLPMLTKGGVACCHDYFTAHLPHVRTEFEAAAKANGMRVGGVVPGDSNCGIGFARAAPTSKKK